MEHLHHLDLVPLVLKLLKLGDVAQQHQAGLLVVIQKILNFYKVVAGLSHLALVLLGLANNAAANKINCLRKDLLCGQSLGPSLRDLSNQRNCSVVVLVGWALAGYLKEVVGNEVGGLLDKVLDGVELVLLDPPFLFDAAFKF